MFFRKKRASEAEGSDLPFSRVDNYKLKRKLGEGSFGDIYLGTQVDTHLRVAIKVENKSNGQVPLEVKFLGHIAGNEGVPKVLASFQLPQYNVMVMDLLGPSLEDIFVKRAKKFSLKTVLMCGIQMVARLRTVHESGMIHRDIKPDNFLIGASDNTATTVHIIDFGLAKFWRDSHGRHIKYREGKALTGTARYASINTHEGREQSRRDDLESVGYVLVYFLVQNLPWSGLNARNKREKYERICAVKKETDLEKLCAGHPHQLVEYIMYCRQLGFEDTPDYDHIFSLFNAALAENGLSNDLAFDWVKG